MKRAVIAPLSAVAFVGLVIASNVLTSRFGLVFGVVTAGTFTAGLVLAARDAVRESAGLAISFACVLAGAIVSYFMSSPKLALASGVAFLLSEVFDAFVYEPLRHRGRVRALAASNVVGAVVDSAAFLWLAGFSLWPALPWQIGTKWLFAVVLPVLVLWGARAVLRHSFRTASA